MKHKYDCEIWQAADILKELHKWEDMLQETDRDAWKDFQHIVNDFEDLLEIIDHRLEEAYDEYRFARDQLETEEDLRYAAEEREEELRGTLQNLRDAVKSAIELC